MGNENRLRWAVESGNPDTIAKVVNELTAEQVDPVWIRDVLKALGYTFTAD